MDIEFTPKSCGPDGAFFTVHGTDGAPLFYVACHAYQQDDGTWAPKTPPGAYTGVRGTHRIMNGPGHTLGPEFETFEITGVVGHSGVLFHKGNWPQTDSDGCFLTGIQLGPLNGSPAVLESGVAFDKFMALQAGADTFNLTVCNT